MYINTYYIFIDFLLLHYLNKVSMLNARNIIKKRKTIGVNYMSYMLFPYGCYSLLSIQPFLYFKNTSKFGLLFDRQFQEVVVAPFGGGGGRCIEICEKIRLCVCLSIMATWLYRSSWNFESTYLVQSWSDVCVRMFLFTSHFKRIPFCEYFSQLRTSITDLFLKN